MEISIRKRKKDDCAKLAHLVTVVWNETYNGIVPDSFLSGLYLNEEKRYLKSYNSFDENNNHVYVLEIDNVVVGFVSVCKCEDDDYLDCGEIQALNIISDYKGMGYGKQLFDVGTSELKNMGFDKMIIGCLEGNPSNEFYKHMGGKYIKQRIFEKLNLPENVYYFDEI